jgi:hypothetical protein
MVKRALVPEDRNGHRPARFLQRALYSHALAAAERREPGTTTPSEAAAVAQRCYGDEVTGLVLRGASSPAAAAAPAWAGILSHDVVGDFFATLEPLGAGARLLNACPHVTLDGINTVSFPRRSGPTAAITGWVAEQAPIPNIMFNLQSAVLGPVHRLACIATVTRELIESSAGETVLTTMMREGSSLALDTKLFSADAASPAACAGLLNGIAPLSATSGTDGAAMISDLSKIAAAIAPFATGLWYVMHPMQASFVNLRRGWAVADDIVALPSLGVPAGTVIGLDPAALASAYGPDPEIKSSKEGVLHEDTAPLAIVSAGTPPVIAAPTRSLWQSDCIATLLILRAAWTWRGAGAVAWISGASWGATS